MRGHKRDFYQCALWNAIFRVKMQMRLDGATSAAAVVAYCYDNRFLPIVAMTAMTTMLTMLRRRRTRTSTTTTETISRSMRAQRQQSFAAAV